MSDHDHLIHPTIKHHGFRFQAAIALVAALLLIGLTPATAAAQPADVVELGTDRAVSPAGTLTTTSFSLEQSDPSRGAEANGSRWSIEVDVPDNTQQIGLQWQGDPIAQFGIRTPLDGSWSTASTLTGDPTEAPDNDSGRPGAGPLWLGSEGVDRVRIELIAGLVSDVKLDVMSFAPLAAEPNGNRAGSSGIARPATRAGGPSIHLRSTWAPGGWNPVDPICGPKPKVNDDLRHGIVHHTAGPNSYRRGDVPAILAGIYRFHTRTRGWCDIAYNFLIDRFGGVWEGRLGGVDNAAWGGHTKGFNSDSVGIALLGSFQAPGIRPSAAMKSSLRSTLAWKIGAQGLDPLGRTNVRSEGNPKYPDATIANLPVINGHRDTSTTSCPGSYVYDHLPRLRLEVIYQVAGTRDPVRWRPHVTGARYWTQMLADAEGPLTRPSRIGTLTSSVERAGMTQGDLTAEVVLSPTVDARAGTVDRLYRVAFGRSPDTWGMRVNVANLDRGLSKEHLAGNFLRSVQFRARYGAPDDRTFTTLLFQNAFGRNPSAASFAYWQRQIDAGTSREQMLLHFVEHPEHRARVEIATRITTGFFVMLRRVPSSASLAYWTPRLEAGVRSRELVVGLLRHREYLARF